jgi:hypothetical protein
VGDVDVPEEEGGMSDRDQVEDLDDASAAFFGSCNLKGA